MPRIRFGLPVFECDYSCSLGITAILQILIWLHTINTDSTNYCVFTVYCIILQCQNRPSKQRMADASSCGSSALQNAILQMWTPAVGVRSIDELCSSRYISHLPKGIPDISRQLIPAEYSDSKPPFVIEEKILSGSWSEGLFLYGHSDKSLPDIDFMYVLKHISFSEENQQSGKLEESNYLHFPKKINSRACWKKAIIFKKTKRKAQCKLQIVQSEERS